MTTDNNHPITPPPELLGKWEEDWHHAKVKHTDLEDHIATQAARWGADQELEACCEWVESEIGRKEWAAELRAARRPQPPSLKELALAALAAADGADHPVVCTVITADQHAIIRQALESLPEPD